MHESRTYKFLGLGVRQTKVGITIDQNLHVSSISPTDIRKGKSLRKDDELSQEEKTELKKTDWSNDVGIHSDTIWCCIWCVSEE